MVIGSMEVKRNEEAKLYLIGRWGAEDRSLEALQQLAHDRKKADILKSAQDQKAEAEAVISNPDKEVDYFMEHGYTRYA